MQQYDYPRPVYAKEHPKDVPEQLLVHRWQRTVDFNKLPKIQLKVKMCCSKCEEKVLEEIWELPGVFDVRAYWIENKVVVTSAVVGLDERAALDEYAVLRKARKIDCRARFVELDPKERQPGPKPSPKGGDSRPKADQPARPPEYRPPPPQIYSTFEPRPYTHPPPSPDGVTPFHFLFLILLLVSMFVFRK